MRREAAASWAVQSGNVRHLKCEHCENRTPEALARQVLAEIRQAMKAAGISQRDIAKATGIPLVTLNRRLVGTGKPMDLSEVAAIAAVLGLSLTEVALRAERALGQAIRAGQERGEIAPPSRETGRVAYGLPDENPMPRPADYLGNSGQTTSEIYALTDGVTDGRFEAALDQAGD